MNPVELIRKKRNGGALSRKELQFFVAGYLSGAVPDYQMSSFLMATCLNGMTKEETSALTEVMLHSGEVINLSSIPGIKVDKHSTGGVGDKVSLILAPMVAACGVPVPMISGRGLGHTGGTLDKLASIPGFRTDLSISEYKKTIEETGLVFMGQTNEIAPADRRMYSLRDVTATVESIPLIASSIMSKKLAEGIDALVLDVKTGNGAFMQKQEDALELANTLISIGSSMGKKTIGFVTDMNQPLGRMIGNWLEVLETLECLRGKNVPDLMEVTFVLGGAMVFLGGKAGSLEEGMKVCSSAVWSGKAYEKFLEIARTQGGDISYLEQSSKYPQASYIIEVKSTSSGYVSGFETRRLGLLAGQLGAGREKLEDTVDPKAGIVLAKKIGDKVEKNDILAVLHTDREEALGTAERELLSCVHVGDTIATRQPCIHALVDADGIHPWDHRE